MKILSFGSMNIDNTYSVDEFVQPGETMTAKNLSKFCGGKGLNQSIALASAGADVAHFGCVGEDGYILLDMLKSRGVNTDSVIKIDNITSGHAIIQVDSHGQNSILLYPGANRRMTPELIDRELEKYSCGDWLLIQNETNCLEYIMRAANKKGMKIAFNPSPMDGTVSTLPLELVDLFLVNEIEGAAVTGKEITEEITAEFEKLFPNAAVILTLGKKGSIFKSEKDMLFQPSYCGTVKDTTGAGDTYTGFFIANYINGVSPQECMRIAAMASTVQISRDGAAIAIPKKQEVLNALKNHCC